MENSFIIWIIGALFSLNVTLSLTVLGFIRSDIKDIKKHIDDDDVHVDPTFKRQVIKKVFNNNKKQNN